MIKRLEARRQAKQEADQQARINLFGASVLNHCFPIVFKTVHSCDHQFVLAPETDQWRAMLVAGNRTQITYQCVHCYSEVSLPVEE